MKCTYDGTELVFRTGAKRTKRAGVTVLRLTCPLCKELFLADDTEYSHPYQTHPNRLGEMDKTKPYSIRLSKRQIENVENGKACLTISGNRLQLQYIP